MSHDVLNRRSLLAAAGTLGTFFAAPRAGGAEDEGAPRTIHDDYPTQEPAAVREVVAAAHTRIERVRELVEARPELANAAWDWGFGDWESALGAASHMGRRDIAELLLAHGARPDLFTFAMLGNLAAVRAAVDAMPGVQTRRGPHGITLLAHARAGGAGASEVAAYLEALGDAEPAYASAQPTQQQAAEVAGTYVFGDGENDRFVIEVSDRGALVLRRGDASHRQLFHLGGLEFHPTGAPSARIRLLPAAGAPARLEIHNPGLVLTAIRRAAP
ncbi:MAG TPA: hypothetical protein VMM55_12905 [Thermohalobaculum sp.]|nr:hypothetical protein [Thermohalobaculum sp.]